MSFFPNIFHKILIKFLGFRESEKDRKKKILYIYVHARMHSATQHAQSNMHNSEYIHRYHRSAKHEGGVYIYAYKGVGFCLDTLPIAYIYSVS